MQPKHCETKLNEKDEEMFGGVKEKISGIRVEERENMSSVFYSRINCADV